MSVSCRIMSKHAKTASSSLENKMSRHVQVTFKYIAQKKRDSDSFGLEIQRKGKARWFFSKPCGTRKIAVPSIGWSLNLQVPVEASNPTSLNVPESYLISKDGPPTLTISHHLTSFNIIYPSTNLRDPPQPWHWGHNARLPGWWSPSPVGHACRSSQSDHHWCGGCWKTPDRHGCSWHVAPRLLMCWYERAAIVRWRSKYVKMCQNEWELTSENWRYDQHLPTNTSQSRPFRGLFGQGSSAYSKSKYTFFPHCAHVPVLLRGSVFRGWKRWENMSAYTAACENHGSSCSPHFLAHLPIPFWSSCPLGGFKLLQKADQDVRHLPGVDSQLLGQRILGKSRMKAELGYNWG